MEKVKRCLATLGAVLVALIVVLIFFLVISGDNPSNLFFACLLICITVIPALAGIFMFKKMSKADNTLNVSKTQHLTKERSIEPAKPRRQTGSKGKLRLVGGLFDLPQGTICKVVYNKDRIMFFASGQEFTLQAEKMLDVSVMTTTEIQKQYVSSIGGAVAGAVLLGPLGAIIGGSASKKTIRNKQKYLVIAYVSGADTKYIVFDVTTSPNIGSRLQTMYRYLKKNEKVKIDL